MVSEDDDRRRVANLVLKVSVDYGTTAVRVSHCLSHVDNDPDPYAAQLLGIQQGQLQVSSKVGFVKSPEGRYKLSWGAKLEDIIQGEQLDEEELFELHGLAICLYPLDVQGDRRAVFEAQLAKYAASAGLTRPPTPEDAMQHHLRKIRRRALQALSEEYRSKLTPEQYGCIRQQWSLTVPEIATAVTIQRFTELVRRAGYPDDTTLIPEGQAAACWLIHGFGKSVRGLAEQSKVQVCRLLSLCGVDSNAGVRSRHRHRRRRARHQLLCLPHDWSNLRRCIREARACRDGRTSLWLGDTQQATVGAYRELRQHPPRRASGWLCRHAQIAFHVPPASGALLVRRVRATQEAPNHPTTAYLSP